jgi:hypothetical protein
MNPKVGEIWLGTYKYVESQLIEIHEVEILSNSNGLVKFKRIDNGKELTDIVYSFIEWFKKIK